MGIDLATWHPGLILALVSVLAVFTTALVITTATVWLVQWRKAKTVEELRRFVQELTDQGYTVDEIERLAGAFFDQSPAQGVSAKRPQIPARSA